MKYTVSKKEKPYKILLFAFAVLLSLTYIVYRIGFTLPFELGFFDIFFGILVVLFEIIDCFDFVVYFFNTLIVSKSSPKTPLLSSEKFPDVDVFIATINEDLGLLEQTICSCKNMFYPDKKLVHIYVCDDGNRKDLKNLSKKLGVSYITRKDNKGAKAGNYNNALKNSKSDYIAIFDADMQPYPDFLLKTVPFFVKYDNVGFVQTPQNFKNPDIFQRKLSLNTPFEQDYFYHHIQLARNNNNSTILCGTNCVISRKALKSVGWFAEASIAEDIATGMLIENNGYRGIALDEDLASGESVRDLNAFVRQRIRWGRGCIQAFRNYGLFWRKGLNIRQKMDYLFAFKYWLFGSKRFVYFLLPLLFAYFGIIIIKCDIRVFIPLFFTQYFVRRYLIDILEGRVRSATWSKIYEVILMPALAAKTLKELFVGGELKFDVTPKNVQVSEKQTNKLLRMHLILLLMNLLGVGLSLYKGFTIGFEEYVLPLVWLTTNILYLLVALVFDLRPDNDIALPKKRTKKYGISAYIGLFKRGI